MSLQVRVSDSYGTRKIYPACEKSKLLAKLVGRKTLNVGDVKILKALGYEVNVVQESVTL